MRNVERYASYDHEVLTRWATTVHKNKRRYDDKSKRSSPANNDIDFCDLNHDRCLAALEKIEDRRAPLRHVLRAQEGL